MRKSFVRALVGAGVTAALVAWTGTAAMAYPGARTAADVSTNGTRTPQVVVGVGSDTTYEVMQALDTLYNRSPGCALINDKSKMAVLGGAASTFYDERCIDGGQLSYALTYTGLTTAENLYHDFVTEAFPVGSGNGKDIQTNFLSGSPAGPSFTASGAGVGFGRSSANNGASFVSGNYTVYGTAFAREGIGFWVGLNNTHVRSVSTVPTPNLSKTELHDIWIGNAGGQCLTTWAGGTDSTDGTYANVSGIVNYGANAIIPYATQSGSGTGKTFAQLIGGAAATDLQNCLPAAYKAGMPTDHIIFENNAGPICQAGTNNSSQAIFPYSFGRFTQNKGGTGGDADGSLCGGALGLVNLDAGAPGTISTLGIAPSVTADRLVPPAAGSYPLGRYLYAYFPVLNGVTGFNLNDPTTWHLQSQQIQAAMAYLHPTLGWICINGSHNAASGQNAQHTLNHGKDPVTGKLYGGTTGEIATTMKANGFSSLTSATTDTTSTFTGTSFCRYGV
jgi:hypothetical protein